MLTRPHRQVAATIALALFTIAPTAWVARTVHALGRPGHAREVEAEIGRRLGLLVHIGNATHPRPDVDVLLDVSLRMDDAGHGQIAHADRVRLVRSGGEMTLRVGHLGLSGEGASDAVGRIVNLMRRMAASDESRVSLVADLCDVTLDGRVETLRDLAVIVQLDRASPSLSASYLIADENARERTRCELSVTCEARGSTKVAIRTMDGSVSARALSLFFDADDWFGRSARLDGSLALSRLDGSGWDAEFRGEIAAVDLSSVVGRRFAGHRLSGIGKLAIESARWGERSGGQGPGWVAARGVLTAGPGSISMGLLDAMRSRMRFRLASPSDPDRPDLDYQSLGLAFAMNGEGEIMLRGALGGEYAPDAVIVQGHRASPLARAPEGAANVRGLWNTLIPATPENLAPAVPEMHALRSLPLPPGVAGKISAN
jgi:hypothetical protein